MAKKVKRGSGSKRKSAKRVLKAAKKSRRPAKKARKAAKKKPTRRARTILEGAMYAALPPYKCQRTLEPGVCLKFYKNPITNDYDVGGERVDCSTCEYFF